MVGRVFVGRRRDPEFKYAVAVNMHGEDLFFVGGPLYATGTFCSLSELTGQRNAVFDGWPTLYDADYALRLVEVFDEGDPNGSRHFVVHRNELVRRGFVER